MNTPSFDDILDEHRPRIVFGAAHAECSCGRWQHEQMEIAAREVLTPIRGLIETVLNRLEEAAAGDVLRQIADAAPEPPTPQQRALPRPSTTPPMWARQPNQRRRERSQR